MTTTKVAKSVNDIDNEATSDLLKKIAKIRKENGPGTPDEAYWTGYLHAYCDQNAISYERL